MHLDKHAYKSAALRAPSQIPKIVKDLEFTSPKPRS